MADRLEERRRADGGELGGQHGLLPRGGHERHRGQVVDLLRPALLERLDERELVEEVGLDQLDAVADRGQVLVARGRAADDAEDVVPLAEEELREQRAVLAADPGDEGSARGHGRR